MSRVSAGGPNEIRDHGADAPSVNSGILFSPTLTRVFKIDGLLVSLSAANHCTYDVEEAEQTRDRIRAMDSICAEDDNLFCRHIWLSRTGSAERC
jgi:hypothetical protein